ncbi:hypothetical protein SEPCBS119000_002329 [Sporothrix epigloea]|uniref:Fe2OG dioxygenase domain-containing protein n=1 Tax=Sporothrix epigloea TaxID=1892477 RepID=A0ABP0DFM4_9PEZI
MPAASIPVIDLAGADEGGDVRDSIASALVEAAVEHGFVYIRNQGLDIPATAVNGAFDIARRLFMLPTASKEACKIQTNNHGWAGMRVETLDPKTQRVGDPKEAFNFGEFVNGKAQQPLPAELAADESESQIGVFFDLCYRLCLKLNDLLGIGLGVSPPDFFTAAHRKEAGPSGNTLRLLYYPPRLDTETDRSEDIRAGAHSDYGSLTLLFRLAGQAGLEICTRDGSWAPVPVMPPGTGVEDDEAPPILVNIGDLLSYWTGGLLRSTVHRVVFPLPGAETSTANVTPGESTKEPRYSIAFFCHPANNSPLSAVPSARVAEAVSKAQSEGQAVAAPRKILTAGEHLQMRLQSTYLDLYDKT